MGQSTKLMYSLNGIPLNKKKQKNSNERTDTRTDELTDGRTNEMMDGPIMLCPKFYLGGIKTYIEGLVPKGAKCLCIL